jgi:hypothetical protein
MINYKEFFTELYDNCICEECDCHDASEQYPTGGYKVTDADVEADEKMVHRIAELMAVLEKSIPTNPSKWSAAKAAAKRKFKVYPSAYANLWAAKKYKSMGGGWRSGKNEVHYPHKRRDPMGQEDADINNDGTVDLIDKMLKAKRDLYKRYLVAKKKGQTDIY